MRKLRQKVRSRPGGEAGDGHSLTWPRDPGYSSHACAGGQPAATGPDDLKGTSQAQPWLPGLHLNRGLLEAQGRGLMEVGSGWRECFP